MLKISIFPPKSILEAIINNVYAKVDFDKEEAIILTKEELDNKIFEDAIKNSGYRYYIKN